MKRLVFIRARLMALLNAMRTGRQSTTEKAMIFSLAMASYSTMKAHCAGLILLHAK